MAPACQETTKALLEGNEMKTLVAFYSRHGHTRIVGKRIARILGAEIEEIVDKKNRQGLATWFYNAFDEELRTPTKIEKVQHNPSDFDLVIVGTPIWDGISPAVKTYLSENKFKKVAFFVTFGASAENAAYVMESIIKKKPLAILELQDRQIMAGANKEIRTFCKGLRR